MTRYLLDTDTLSLLVRDPSGAVARHLAAAGEDAVATSSIVAGELRFGAQRSGSEALVARVDELLARPQVLPLDERVASTYAGVRLRLERAGTPIGPNGLWIAAHALAEGRVVVTGNRREFRRAASASPSRSRKSPKAACQRRCRSPSLGAAANQRAPRTGSCRALLGTDASGHACHAPPGAI